MNAPDSHVLGNVFYPESKEELAEILSRDGFAVTIGQWALHLEGCARRFELGYVGNITPEAPFQVDGSGYGVPVSEVAECCERLAKCLREHGIAYEFLHVANDDEVLCEYVFGP